MNQYQHSHLTACINSCMHMNLLLQHRRGYNELVGSVRFSYNFVRIDNNRILIHRKNSNYFQFQLRYISSVDRKSDVLSTFKHRTVLGIRCKTHASPSTFKHRYIESFWSLFCNMHVWGLKKAICRVLNKVVRWTKLVNLPSFNFFFFK